MSLVNLLQENLIPEPIEDKEKIGLSSPIEKGDFQLTVYLYRIEECREYVSTEMIKLSDGNLKYPPIPFNLYYLITAHSKADIKSKAVDEQKILGRVVQVLNDNGVLCKKDLVGTLNEQYQEIKIQMLNLSYDEMLKIWNFSNIPYRLSIAYMIGPVLIDSTRIKKVNRVVHSNISIVEKDRR